MGAKAEKRFGDRENCNNMKGLSQDKNFHKVQNSLEKPRGVRATAAQENAPGVLCLGSAHGRAVGRRFCL